MYKILTGTPAAVGWVDNIHEWKRSTIIITYSQQKKNRHVLDWTVEDVVKWLQKYANPEGSKYAYLFEENFINGPCLLCMNDEWLIRIGIENQNDRYYLPNVAHISYAAEMSGAAARSIPIYQLGKCLAISMDLHKLNRQRLCRALKDYLNEISVNKIVSFTSFAGVFVVLQGGTDVYLGDSDSACVFRQESFFHWAFGYLEPNAFGAIEVDTGRSILFVERISDVDQIYNGAAPSNQELANKYEVDEVYYTENMAGFFKRLNAQVLLTLRGLNTDSGRLTHEARFPGIEEFRVDNKILHPVIVGCRLIKTPLELEVLRYANRISSAAHRHLMHCVKSGMYEYQAESIFQNYCYFHGGMRHMCYTCIGATGSNCAILHYGHAGAPNERCMRNGDMCLFDMGGEYYCYASDITCSYPVDGKFTDDQKLIYEAVLDASRSVLSAIIPGANWVKLHELAERKILSHLLKGGLLKGNVDDMLSDRLGAIFMPHGLGHFLGIDVHDVGGYGDDAPPRPSLPGLQNLRTARVLQVNMVLTVEPGCYFIDRLLDEALASPELSKYIIREKIERFRNFGGVRIEDNVVVTETGHELLTDVPRTVDEIEKWMALSRNHQSPC